MDVATLLPSSTAQMEEEPPKWQLMIRRAPEAAQKTPAMQAKMMKIKECLNCGKCKSKCPYGLDTPELLKRNLKDYEEILAGKPL